MLLGSSGDYRSSNWSVDICLYICVKKEGRNTHFFLSTLCRCDNVFSQTWILLLYFGYLHKVNFNDEYNNKSKALPSTIHNIQKYIISWKYYTISIIFHDTKIDVIAVLYFHPSHLIVQHSFCTGMDGIHILLTVQWHCT